MRQSTAMVLSHPDPDTDNHVARARNFSKADENDIENLMKLEDVVENNDPGSTPSGRGTTIDFAPRRTPSIVELIVQQDGGELKTYDFKSMSTEKQHRLLKTLTPSVSASGQRIRRNGRRAEQVRNLLHETLELDATIRAGNEDKPRQNSNSTDSSVGVYTRSNMGDKVDDVLRRNRRKRARNLSSQFARLIEAPLFENISEIPILDRSDQLKIWDDIACSLFYRRILTDAHQDLCKKLGKWWIKAINPNKQTNNPYSKGAETKPEWWPATPPLDTVGEISKGTLENGLVRHKEPDHLCKSERLILLPHILTKIVDPRNSGQVNYMNAAKLQQISLDSISHESSGKAKHDSWRRFVTEIFRVARMQERCKNGEIDDTTVITVRPSYENWRYKGSADEADEDSLSDGEHDNASHKGEYIMSETLSQEKSLSQNQIRTQLARADGKQEYTRYLHDVNFLSHRENGTSDKATYGQVSDVPNQIPDEPCYNISTASMPRSHQESSLMLHEPFRRHSDTSDRFSSFHCSSYHSSFLPNTNLSHISELQYHTAEPVYSLPAAPICTTGTVLPLPLSAPLTRSPIDMPQFPAFHDAGGFSRSNMGFQASMRDSTLNDHGNLQTLSLQQQSYSDYLHNQDYGQNASKMHILRLDNTMKEKFTYGQENTTSPSRSEFGYEPKSQCNIETRTFDLNDITNEVSNNPIGHMR